MVFLLKEEILLSQHGPRGAPQREQLMETWEFFQEDKMKIPTWIKGRKLHSTEAYSNAKDS